MIKDNSKISVVICAWNAADCIEGILKSLKKQTFKDFEIVVAIILSYIVFKFIPTKEAVLGLVIIILSGLFVSWRAVKNNQDLTKKNDSVVELL